MTWVELKSHEPLRVCLFSISLSLSFASAHQGRDSFLCSSVLELNLPAKENFSSCILEALKFLFNLPFISLLITFAWRRLVFTFALSMLVFAHWRVLSVLDSCQSFQTSDSSSCWHLLLPFSHPFAVFLLPEQRLFIRFWRWVGMYFRTGILFESWPRTLVSSGRWSVSGMESSLPDGVENQKLLRIRWHQWDGLLVPVGYEVLLYSLGF